MKTIWKITAVLLFAGICVSAQGEEKLFSTPEEEASYSLAIRAFRDRIYPTAKKQLEDFIKRYPKSVMRSRAECLLGEAFFYENNTLDSEKIFKKLSINKDYEDISYFWLGKVCVKKGNNEDAKRIFTDFISRFNESPYLPYVEFSLAQIYFDENLITEAAERFESLYIKYGNSPIGIRSWLEIARCFYKSRRYDKAEAELRKLIREVPPPLLEQFLPDAYFLLAQINEKMGLYTRSIRYFRRVLKEKKKDKNLLPQVYYGIGWDYWLIKSFIDSSLWFNMFLKKFPQHELAPSVKLRLAECYISLKDYARAIEQLKRFVADYPKNQAVSGVRYWLAEAYFQKGMLKDAEDEYKAVIQGYPESPYIDKAYYGLGWVFYKRQDYDRSRQMFHKAIEKSQQDSLMAEALMKIGDSYYLENKYNEAIEKYTEVLEKYPGRWSDVILYQIGSTYLKCEEFDKAVAAFDTLIYSYPKSRFLLIAYYKKGNSLLNKGMSKEAMECYENVFKKASSSSLKERAGIKIGKVYYALGEYEKAVNHFKKLADSFPPGRHRALVLYELGICYYRKGDMENAYRYFQQCIQGSGGLELQPEVRFWIGEIFFNKGEYDIAMTAFVGVSEEFQNHELADDSLFMGARCAFLLGEYVESKKILNELMKNKPKSDLAADALFWMAEDLIFLRDYSGAIDIYQRIGKDYPNSYLIDEVYLRQGDVLSGLGKFSDALVSYEKAGQSSYKDVKIKALFNINRIQEKLGRMDKAQEGYLKIAYQYPEETEWAGKCLINAADLLVKLKRADEAVQLYRKVIDSQYPESGEAERKMGQLKVKGE